jgi:hypothetical protein
MVSPRLVAMIPIDEAEAHKPKGGNPDGWDMPYPKLLEALKSQTSGRVLRADRVPPPAAQPPRECPEKLWREFRKDVKVVVDPDDPERPFFIQYTIRP